MSDDRKRVEELTLSVPGGAGGSESIADHMRGILRSIGENPDREGLRHTPERFEKAFRFLTSGYQQDPEKLLNGAMFTVSYDQMVLVKDIEFYSLCEHHLLPFFGKCHVAYIPDQKVVGLSKIPRLVNMLGVVIEARHLCMVMRGVEKQNSETVTSAMLGSFKENPKTREEFLSLIQGK